MFFCKRLAFSYQIYYILRPFINETMINMIAKLLMKKNLSLLQRNFIIITIQKGILLVFLKNFN